MNPYHHNIIFLQESFYFYTYPYAVPVPQLAYNQILRHADQSVEYVDGVAILNAPRWLMINQQPMHHHSHSRSSYLPHPTPESALYDPSFVRHAFEEFLDDSLIMHELETDLDLARQQQVTGGGSGLSEEKISEHLHVEKINPKGDEEEGDICCICLGEYVKKEKMGILDCGHRYHAECIKRWLLSKNVCPMCRSTALTL